MVNGPVTPLATGMKPAKVKPKVPEVITSFYLCHLFATVHVHLRLNLIFQIESTGTAMKFAANISSQRSPSIERSEGNRLVEDENNHG